MKAIQFYRVMKEEYGWHLLSNKNQNTPL